MRGDDARNAAGRGFDLLDAFVYGNFQVGDQYLTLRAGQQVVNWGESLFIQGGINSYVPLNVAALRTPGSEIKKALLPVPAIYANLSLPENFSLEAFYMMDWKQTQLDPVGTFFSGSDFFGPGGMYAQLGGEYPGGVSLNRIDSDDPSRQGQFGVKIGHYADWLNQGTDLALYYTRFHSHLPILTFTEGNLGAIPTSPANVAQACAVLGTPTPIACQANLNTIIGAAASSLNYLDQYVEGIDQYGMSFNTSIPVFGGTAFSGEVAYSPNMPFQHTDAYLTGATSNAIGACDFFAGRPCRV